MVNLYRFIQPEDVLLVEGRSKISQIIQLLTKSSWSHAAIYVGDYLKESKDPKVQNRLRQIDDGDQHHINKRTVQACLGGCSEYKVICSGMIANAFQSVGYPIVPELLPDSDFGDTMANNPYGSKLKMRHYSQISPRDFDLSPNFEIVKYNIIGLETFNYQLLWEEKLGNFK